MPRGAEISNDTGLPLADHSRLAVDFQMWCKYNSWAQCESCMSMQPRDLTERTLHPDLPATTSSAYCSRCKAKESYEVPKPEDVPEPLRGLSREALAALSPLVIDVGPEHRSKDEMGRPNGYREHACMIKFSWHKKSSKARIKEIDNRAMRRDAKKAYDFLCASEATAYSRFKDDHKEFLSRFPDADKTKRKRWHKFLETPGIECALWPHLFWKLEMCLTAVRAKSPTRMARAKRSTLEEALRDLSSEDEEVQNEDSSPRLAGHSIKRAYASLAPPSPNSCRRRACR